MLSSIILTLSVLFASISTLVTAHGYHPKSGTTKSQDWAEMHMLEEHHITNFDPSSFFSLHDYDNNNGWDKSEIRRTYGLDDESNADLTEAHKLQILQDVFALFDQDHTGEISRDEYLQRHAQGFRLPDFGHGPGHHGDDEYEYEIHHFEKFHGDGAREEDLTHEEDIAHFAKHDREEDEREALERMEQRVVVEENIPGKFRRE